MKNSRVENNTVRIISGKWKSRKIHFPTTVGLRPTGDRIKETLFNWLMNDVLDARCLDLFSGSGALGFEAASRAAEVVVMVDSNNLVVDHLNRTKIMLQADNVDIVFSSAKQFLTAFSGKPFDIVFLDPPFHQNILADILPLLISSGCLREGSLIYMESEKTAEVDLSAFSRVKEKEAGAIAYRLFEFK